MSIVDAGDCGRDVDAVCLSVCLSALVYDWWVHTYM